jgi:hypothetical protein
MLENQTIGFDTVTVEKSGSRDKNWVTYRSLLSNLDMKNSDYVFFVDDMTYAIPDNVRYEFRGPNPGAEPVFWGKKSDERASLLGGGPTICRNQAFVLSRNTVQAVKKELSANSASSPCALNGGSQPVSIPLSTCLAGIGSPCREAIDFQGKQQIMHDAVALLSESEVPAHLRTGSDCCSVLPVAFLGVGKMANIRTGTFSYLYFYDYFIRDTAVYGREYLRPLNGIDAGVGKPQIGF